MQIVKFLTFSLLIILVSCESDVPEVGVAIPDTYTFERDGSSTVDFRGQTARLDMLSEMKSYVVEGDAGKAVSRDLLLDMFGNQNSPFADEEFNATTKNLESKTLISDVDYYKGLFAELERASNAYVANPSEAMQGVSGLLQRGNTDRYILVNEKGWEFTQFIEKGLLGSVFFHQIFNVYLTESRIGPDVDNESLVEGNNYTAKEHHFDEAFGYWGVPVDFPDELAAADRRFWATYTYGRSSLTGSLDKLKSAFLYGRTAIVNSDQGAVDAAVAEIYLELEIMSVATAIHYLNSSLEDINAGDIGNLFHHLSEAYMFIRAIKVHPSPQLSVTEINEVLANGLGTEADFWTADAALIRATKNTIVNAYPELAAVANDL
jgi:hypothetical protein